MPLRAGAIRMHYSFSLLDFRSLSRGPSSTRIRETTMADKTPVAPRDPGKTTSPLVGPTDEESTIVMDAAANKCIWNDQEFPDGAMVESEGATYECTYGRWTKVD